MAYESYRWLISGMGSILVYHPIFVFFRDEEMTSKLEKCKESGTRTQVCAGQTTDLVQMDYTLVLVHQYHLT